MFNLDLTSVSLLAAAAVTKFDLPFDLGKAADLLKLGSVGLGFLLVIVVAWFFKTSPGVTTTQAKLMYAYLAFTLLIFGLYLVAQQFDERKMPRTDHERLMNDQKVLYDKELKDQKDRYDEIIATMKNAHMISGKIAQPKEKDTADKKKIDCTGTVAKFHKVSGLHIWLAVEIDGFIWPKDAELEVQQDGQWAVPIFQDGPESPFSLSLLVVDGKTHEQFNLWIRGQNFEKLAWPEGALRLDRIDGLRIKETP